MKTLRALMSLVLLAAAAQYDCGAGAGQSCRDRPAEAAGGPGDDSQLAAEIGQIGESEGHDETSIKRTMVCNYETDGLLSRTVGL